MVRRHALLALRREATALSQDYAWPILFLDAPQSVLAGAGAAGRRAAAPDAQFVKGLPATAGVVRRIHPGARSRRTGNERIRVRGAVSAVARSAANAGGGPARVRSGTPSGQAGMEHCRSSGTQSGQRRYDPP